MRCSPKELKRTLSTSKVHVDAMIELKLFAGYMSNCGNQ